MTRYTTLVGYIRSFEGMNALKERLHIMVAHFYLLPCSHALLI